MIRFSESLSLSTNKKKITFPELKFSKKPTILVLSGGGLNGIAHIGLSYALEQLGLLSNINTFAGTSIGALISTLLAIGYTPKELEEFVLKFHFDKLKKINFSNFISSYGLDNGEKIEYVVKTLLKEKIGSPNITFNELFKKKNKVLVITSSCVDDGKTYYFSYQSDPNMPIHLAIRMSMCIPFLYNPIKYKNKYFVDGGCTNNYPIAIFKKRLSEVIGVYIQGDSDVKQISNISDYLYKLLYTLIDNGNKTAIKYKSNTILLICDSSNIINFELSKQKKKELFNYGYSMCLKKLVLSI